MTTVIAFWVFLLSASTAMFLAGRKQERVFVFVILTATVSTLLANAALGIGTANKFVISIGALDFSVDLHRALGSLLAYLVRGISLKYSCR